ncbi:MAG: glycosyltransferase [Acidobacteriota bacterium]
MLRRSLGLDADTPLVGMVACLKPQKQPEHFVAVAAQVARIVPKAHFVLAGDGERRDAVERAVREAGLTAQFHLLGWRRDPETVVGDLDVLVLTSRHEGLPRVCPEAMSAGKPVVATAVDGTPEAVAHGVTGFVHPFGDIEAMAASVVTLLLDRKLARRLGEAGRARSEAWDINQMVRRQERLYQTWRLPFARRHNPIRHLLRHAFPGGSTMKQRMVVSAIVCLSLQAAAYADAARATQDQGRASGRDGEGRRRVRRKVDARGVESTTALARGVKLERHERYGELTDLKAETVTQIDFDKKTYTVKTFAQIRKEIEEQMRRMREAQDSNETKDQQPSSEVQYEITLDVKETGRKQQIASYDCREVVITATMHQKGKAVEESGGSIVTLSMWLGPELAAMKEIEAFELAYAKALKLQEFAGEAAQQMASALAMYPQMQEAVKAIQSKKVDMRGTAIRSALTMETVAAPGAATAEDADSQEQPKTLGGMFGKMASKLGKKKGESKAEDPAKPATPGRTTVMTTTTEILSVSASANPADLTIPAGFKLKN